MMNASKCHTFYEKRMATEIAADALGEQEESVAMTNKASP